MATISDIEAELIRAGEAERDRAVLRLTPGQWRTILESRSFLDAPGNSFHRPRRFMGAKVEIIPDESFR